MPVFPPVHFRQERFGVIAGTARTGFAVTLAVLTPRIVVWARNQAGENLRGDSLKP